jgi:Cu2+-exporting ATPase
MSFIDNIKSLFDNTPKNARIFKVEGMHCVNCENHVKNALLKIDGIQSVTASHKKSQVAVVAPESVSDDSIKAAIAGCGFEVKS